MLSKSSGRRLKVIQSTTLILVLLYWKILALTYPASTPKCNIRPHSGMRAYPQWGDGGQPEDVPVGSSSMRTVRTIVIAAPSGRYRWWRVSAEAETRIGQEAKMILERAIINTATPPVLAHHSQSAAFACSHPSSLKMCVGTPPDQVEFKTRPRRQTVGIPEWTHHTPPRSGQSHSLPAGTMDISLLLRPGLHG